MGLLTTASRRLPLPSLVVVEGIEAVVDPAAIRLTGSVRVSNTAVSVRLLGRRGDTRSAATRAEGRHFVVDVPLAGMNRWGDKESAPPSGPYEVTAVVGRFPELPVRARWPCEQTALAPKTLLLGVAAIEVVQTGDRLVLQLSRPLAAGEQGPGGYKALGLAYKDLVADPVTPTVDALYVESFAGMVVGDSPRAVLEEFRRRRPDATLYCGVADLSVAVPPGVDPVVVRSARWFEVLATSRYVVTSHWLPGVFARRPGQVIVQTWHGSPFKLLGSDRPKHQQQKGYRRRTAKQVAQWSILVSQSPYSTAIFRKAYQYKGRVLESGYPRDDALSCPPDGERIRQARRRLGIPDGHRAVLYAPTFRDGAGRLVEELDYAAVVDALGPLTTLLVRGHRYTVKHGATVDGPRVIDVTTYPDVTDLFLLADVCITDYSSLMFDFTITGKPILFFVPDLDKYRDITRGTYFDLAEVSPGPLVTTTTELVAALHTLPAIGEQYASRYQAWQRRFHPFDDGHAAVRVVDAMLEG